MLCMVPTPEKPRKLKLEVLESPGVYLWKLWFKLRNMHSTELRLLLALPCKINMWINVQSIGSKLLTKQFLSNFWWPFHDTIRYDTRWHFNVRSKADISEISQLNLLKSGKKEIIKEKRICSEVVLGNVLGAPGGCWNSSDTPAFCPSLHQQVTARQDDMPPPPPMAADLRPCADWSAVRTALVACRASQVAYR